MRFFWKGRVDTGEKPADAWIAYFDHVWMGKMLAIAIPFTKKLRYSPIHGQNAYCYLVLRINWVTYLMFLDEPTSLTIHVEEKKP